MTETVGIDKLTPDARNANQGTKRGLDLLDESLRQNGAGRSVLLDKHNRVIAGNKTVERAADVGIDDVVIVDSDGSKLVAVRRTDLDLETDPRARQLAYADNRVAEVDLAWDPSQIAADLEAGLDLSGMFYPEELSAILEQAVDDLLGADEQGEPELTRADVPDAVFPTDNDWGVPLLDANLQATMLVAPFMAWGAGVRKARMTGTYHFYVEDYRYEALWSDPSDVLNSRCVAVVEPNFSCYTEMPRAVALWAIYRKRWLARFWQSFGLRVFVDLNVAIPHRDINLLGVPRGWRSYATRGYTERIDQTDEEYELACQHAETSDILFLVYGGGKEVRTHCLERGWLWFMEQRDGVKANG